LLFSRFDRKVQEQFIYNATPTADMVEECFHDIMRTANRSGELSLKRQSYESRYVELFEMEKAGILNRHSVMCGSASIYLSLDFDGALELCSPQQKNVLTALDRELGLSSKGYAKEVNLNELRRKCFPDTDTFTLEQTLLQMNGRGIVAYRPNDRSICYEVCSDDVSDSERRIITDSTSGRRAFKIKRLQAMLSYGTSSSCLRRFLLDALADTDHESNCGFCDNCL
jgi:hypothetical protein